MQRQRDDPPPHLSSERTIGPIAPAKEKSSMVNTEVHWPFPWLTTPNTPDLACFVEHRHGFQVDANFHFWLEYAPWEFVNGVPTYIPHQVYFRIKCGKASFFQRVRAWMAPLGTNPISLLGVTPDWVLGGDFRPTPSDWVKFPVQSAPKDYWFGGEYRNPTQATWRWDASVGHSFDQYENGTLSTVGWDDTGGDKDYDDLIMEVAVVYRRSYFDVLEAEVLTQAALRRFTRQDLPKYRASDRVPPKAAT
jgi:hypothetical protein